MIKRLAFAAVAFGCLLTGGPHAFALETEPATKVSPWLQSRLAGGEQTEFLVLLDKSGRPSIDATISREELYHRLAASAKARQSSLLAELSARGIPARAFYLVNAVLVRGDAELAHSLAARPEVTRIVGNPRIRIATEKTVEMSPLLPEVNQWNITMVRAPDVWATYGATGQGIVVASADTGVDWAHPDFQSRYRGYIPSTGDADHTYSWHDAFNTWTVPYDDVSHGTHTLGIMAGGNGYGVAPGATWIACKNMNNGAGTPASYIECMEWTMAPYPQGGDPMTQGRPDLAADIVNNSWSCPPSEGCDPQAFDEPLARLRQAGILMVASAMNTGPACSTVDNTPALSPDAFTVGAVDDHRELASFSSRGPVMVDGSGRLKPDLVAPGVRIYSTVPDNGHSTKSGTSMAAPHVAGTVALLWSQRPALRGLVGLTRCIIVNSVSTNVTNPVSQTCGGIPSTTFPNNVLGAGLLDAYAALALPMSDADPAPDVCDCAPSDPTAYAMPIPIAELSWTGKSAFTWGDQSPDTGTGTRYDVLRGELGHLRIDGGIGGGGCLVSDLVNPAASDGFVPAPGTGVYYVVRAGNACGSTGWGHGYTNESCD